MIQVRGCFKSVIDALRGKRAVQMGVQGKLIGQRRHRAVHVGVSGEIEDPVKLRLQSSVAQLQVFDIFGGLFQHVGLVHLVRGAPAASDAHIDVSWVPAEEGRRAAPQARDAIPEFGYLIVQPDAVSLLDFIVGFSADLWSLRIRWIGRSFLGGVPRNLWGRGHGWPLINQGHAGGQWTLRRRSMGSRAIGPAQQAIFRDHAARGHASEVVLRIGPDAGGSRRMVPGRYALLRSEQGRAGGTGTWLEAAVIQRPGVSDVVGHIWTLKGRGVLGCHAGDARPRIIGCFRVGTGGASRDMDIVGAIHPIGSEHVSAVRGCAPRFRAGSGPRLGRNGVHGRGDVISKGLGGVTDRCPPSSGGRCRRVVLERAESADGMQTKENTTLMQRFEFDSCW